jgi:hypothetical protein
MGEKGNVAADDPVIALESIPFDALKGSPETLNSWLDTYLKYREVRELRKATEAAADAAQAAVSAKAATPTSPDGAGTQPST